MYKRTRSNLSSLQNLRNQYVKSGKPNFANAPVLIRRETGETRHPYNKIVNKSTLINENNDCLSAVQRKFSIMNSVNEHPFLLIDSSPKLSRLSVN